MKSVSKVKIQRTDSHESCYRIFLACIFVLRMALNGGKDRR